MFVSGDYSSLVVVGSRLLSGVVGPGRHGSVGECEEPRLGWAKAGRVGGERYYKQAGPADAGVFVPDDWFWAGRRSPAMTEVWYLAGRCKDQTGSRQDRVIIGVWLTRNGKTGV